MGQAECCPTIGQPTAIPRPVPRAARRPADRVRRPRRSLHPAGRRGRITPGPSPAPYSEFGAGFAHCHA
eukprot:556873-Hanusia_phi.AAC.1